MYGSWIYNYLCNLCQSPLKLWVRIPLRRGVLDKTLCDKVCQWLATGLWFSLVTLVSSTNKTDHHDITEILLKVVLSTIILTLSLIHKQTLKEEYWVDIYQELVYTYNNLYLVFCSSINTYCKQNKIFLVIFTDTIIDPWTMVVHLLYTSLTYTVM
jgi:hypothetical protein